MYLLDKKQINVKQTISVLSFSIPPNVWISEWKPCHRKNLLNNIVSVRNMYVIYYTGRIKIVGHASECSKMVDFHEEIEFLWMACFVITMKSKSITVNQSIIINGD